MVVGEHTLNVITNGAAGYQVSLRSKTNDTTMSNQIASTGGTSESPSSLSLGQWGYSLNPAAQTNPAGQYWMGIAANDNQIAATSSPSAAGGDATKVYWGVNMPSDMQSGGYTGTVAYTVVANPLPEPTVTDMALNSSWTDGTPDTVYGQTTHLTGQNLSSVYDVWVDLNNNGVEDTGESVSDLTVVGDNELTFIAPSYASEGQKNVYLEWPDGQVKITNGWSYIVPNNCRSGDSSSACIVEKDSYMIPVKYVNGVLTLVTTKEINSTPGAWYDYNNKQWATAITVPMSMWTRSGYLCVDPYNYKNPIYQASSSGCSSNGYNRVEDYTAGIQKVLSGEIAVKSDFLSTFYSGNILGIWTYIPRYSYEVMRRDAVDLVQQPEDFKIKFEKVSESGSDTWKLPASGCSSVSGNTLTAKSYRVGCGLDRTWQDGSTWATHPAFNYVGRNVNGLWVGKFETSGKTTAPTILPNRKHISAVNGGIGTYYDIAKSVGVSDQGNTGGNGTNLSPQRHGIEKAITHLQKDTEWGAVAYLSSSRYGIGVDKIRINAQMQEALDDNGYGSVGITGCGPFSEANAQPYSDGVNNSSGIWTCSSSNPERSWSGSLGVLASTTGNVYGVYDMAGGAYEYTAGNYSTSDTQTTVAASAANLFKNPASNQFVNIFPSSKGFDKKPAWSASDESSLFNNDVCTYETCGGMANYETNAVQSVNGLEVAWRSDHSRMPTASLNWSVRGGYARDGSVAGIFAHNRHGGDTDGGSSFRVVLVPVNYADN